MLKSVARSAFAAVVAGGMTFTLAVPASGATAPTASDADLEVRAASTETLPEEGSLFAEVEDADNADERRGLLMAEGFEQASGEHGEERYEKTVEGVTLGWSIGPDEEGAVSPMWNVGWSGGPYVSATTSQWHNLAQYGSGIGTAACTLITVGWGAATCGAVGATVTTSINNMDPSAAPHDCWEVRPAAGVVQFSVSPSNQC